MDYNGIFFVDPVSGEVFHKRIGIGEQRKKRICVPLRTQNSISPETNPLGVKYSSFHT